MKRRMIFEMLSVGKRNACTARELARTLGVDPRKVSSLVELERRQGKPICATCDTSGPGYFIPENREEMQWFCETLQHRAKEIQKTRAACLLTIDELPAKEAEI